MGVNNFNDMVSIVIDSMPKCSGTKYQKLAKSIELLIENSVLQEGFKLPPHRILADKIKVTAGTVSRAYSLLERMGLVYARVGDGTFILGKTGIRRKDDGFKNFIEKSPQIFDMSRNTHIPGKETQYLANAFKKLANESKALDYLTRYTPDAGLMHHREAGAKWLAQEAFLPNPEQILCVNGGQHGLQCILMTLLHAGDNLATEQLTYPGLISLCRLMGIKLYGIDIDEYGLVPSSLDELCNNKSIAALYCTPSIQNPTTTVIPVERRKEIAKICQKHNILIIEDESPAVLFKERPLPLGFYAPERSIIISSLSKAVASGLRVGYIYVPFTLINHVSASIRSTCWMATPLTHEIACRWINEGLTEILKQQQITAIDHRKGLVSNLLNGLNYRTHAQSPHFWIEVPEPWRASEIEVELKKRNYLISTAESFVVGRINAPQFIRLSVSYDYGNDQTLYDGVKILTDIIK